MESKSSPFFDQVKKHVVCTPNLNFDEEAYRAGVLEPYAQIEKLADEAGDAPSEEQMRRAVALLKTIFETKRVSADEQRSRFEELAQKAGRSLPLPA